MLAGGFPCQPVSLAGKRLAQDDPRWLWPHVARLVGLLRPRYVLLENVPGLRSKGLGDVLQDLSALGYDAEWEGISAAAVGAPHRRDRVWIVAYPRRQWSLADANSISGTVGGEAGYLASSPRVLEGFGEQRERCGDALDHRGADVADAPSVGRHGSGAEVEGPFVFPRQPDGTGRADWGTEWLSEPAVGRVADGVPNRVARLRALGNAVVPQVAEVVGHLILADASRAN